MGFLREIHVLFLTTPSERDMPTGESREPASSSELMQVAYESLRDLAAAYLHRNRVDHTLQPTALVHEAYIKLAESGSDSDWKGKTHFQAVAAAAMRQILVDHARRRATDKRGGNWTRLTLTGNLASTSGADVDVLALDEAMLELAKRHERKARVVELRFFGGLTCVEAAEQLGVSPKTAEADWYFARAWLHDRIG